MQPEAADGVGRLMSAEQQQWEEITAAVRAHLAKQVELMPALRPEELLSLVTAVDGAMWNELKAQTYDEAVAGRRVQLEKEGLYGG